MKHYELLTILPGTMTETEAQEVASQIKEVVEKNGGKELTMDYNGKSRLAYPMRHIRYGYFFLFNFEATETEIRTIQEKTRLVPQVLRALFQIYNPEHKVGLTFTEAEKTGTENEGAALVSEGKTEIIVEEAPLHVEEIAPEAKTEIAEEISEEAEKPGKNDISMEEIDQKLDELLEKDV